MNISESRDHKSNHMTQQRKMIVQSTGSDEEHKKITSIVEQNGQFTCAFLQ